MFAVVLLGVAPASLLLILLLAAWLAQGMTLASGGAQMESLARLLAYSHDRSIETGVETLAALSGSDAQEGCRSRFDRMLRASPGTDAFLLLRMDGTVECAEGRGVDLSGLAAGEHVRTAIATGRTTIGRYVAMTDGNHLLPIAYPVRDIFGAAPSILVAARPLRWLEHELMRPGVLPPEARVVILRHDGTLLARLPHRSSIPPPSPGLVNAIAGGGVGSFVAPESVGERLYGYAPLNALAPGTFVAVSLPTEVITGPQRPFFWLTAGALALAGCIIVGLLWYASRWLIFTPLERLLAAMRAVRAGESTARLAPTQTLGELAEIAAAFDATVEALDQRGRALEASQRRFRNLFDHVGDAILVHDLQGNIIDANESAGRLFGYTGEAMCHLSVFDLLDDQPRWGMERVWAELEPGRPLALSGVNRRKGGETFPVEVYLAPFASATDQLVVAVVRDMTAHHLAESRLRAAVDRAELANRAKSDFLTGMSHELRTPLNAIIGFADAMRLEVLGPLSPRYREYAGDIASSGHHLVELITDILDLAKIEAGKMELHEDEVCVEHVIEGALRLMRGHAAAANLTLSARTDMDLPLLYGDERRIKQVLINLISNAIRFTPPGGRITVTAALGDKGCLRLAVTDTGIGMAAHEIDRAMEPFGQIDSHIARRSEGTGLGLSLVKGIVELHDGIFRIESVAGAGTTATALFPVARVVVEACEARQA